MTIERKNPYGPRDASALAAFERQLAPLRLPDDLRQFLVDFNGAETAERHMTSGSGPEERKPWN